MACEVLELHHPMVWVLSELLPSPDLQMLIDVTYMILYDKARAYSCINNTNWSVTHTYATQLFTVRLSAFSPPNWFQYGPACVSSCFIIPRQMPDLIIVLFILPDVTPSCLVMLSCQSPIYLMNPHDVTLSHQTSSQLVIPCHTASHFMMLHRSFSASYVGIRQKSFSNPVRRLHA